MSAYDKLYSKKNDIYTHRNYIEEEEYLDDNNQRNSKHISINSEKIYNNLILSCIDIIFNEFIKSINGKLFLRYKMEEIINFKNIPEQILEVIRHIFFHFENSKQKIDSRNEFVNLSFEIFRKLPHIQKNEFIKFFRYARIMKSSNSIKNKIFIKEENPLRN